MAPYEYSRLDTVDEIRLLTLLPGKLVDPLEVLITHVHLATPEENEGTRMPIKELRSTVPPGWSVYETLDGRYIFEEQCTENTTWTHPDPQFPLAAYDGYATNQSPTYKPKFEALSYAWGSTDKTETLLARTAASTSGSVGEVYINKSLASVLRHLRYVESNRVLWIDAICINQADIPERNAQVSRMRYIYKLAQRTVFWIGPATNSSSLALSTLAYFGSQVEYTTCNNHLRSPDAVELDWWHNSVELPYNDTAWQALDDLFNSSWFERLWIVQEVLMCRRGSILQCGNEVVPWNLIRLSVLRLVRKNSPSLSLSKALRRIRNSFCWPHYTPLELLAGNEGRKCTDPRDRIYGILGLIPEQLAERIPINYALPFAEVFKQSFLELMRYSNRLDALQYGRMHNRTLGLPTWVPTWSDSRGVSGVLPAYWAADGSFTAQAVFSAPDQLKAQGLKIATVSSVGKPISRNLHRLPSLIRESWSKILCMTEKVRNDSLLDVLISTYTMYRDTDTYIYFEFCTRTHWKEIFSKIISVPDDNLANSELTEEIQHSFGGDDLDWAFVTTAEGFIGLASSEVQCGM